MRDLTTDLFVSLDGYARGEHAGAYFDMYGPELGRWIDEHLAEPQVLLMGRVTYEVLSPMASTGAGVVDLIGNAFVLACGGLTSNVRALSRTCGGGILAVCRPEWMWDRRSAMVVPVDDSDLVAG